MLFVGAQRPKSLINKYCAKRKISPKCTGTHETKTVSRIQDEEWIKKENQLQINYVNVNVLSTFPLIGNGVPFMFLVFSRTKVSPYKWCTLVPPRISPTQRKPIGAGYLLESRNLVQLSPEIGRVRFNGAMPPPPPLWPTLNTRLNDCLEVCVCVCLTSAVKNSYQQIVNWWKFPCFKHWGWFLVFWNLSKVFVSFVTRCDQYIRMLVLNITTKKCFLSYRCYILFSRSTTADRV